MNWNKRGVSNVLVVALIILIALALLSLLWIVINGFIFNVGETAQIKVKLSRQDIEISDVEFSYPNVVLLILRGAVKGELEITGEQGGGSTSNNLFDVFSVTDISGSMIEPPGCAPNCKLDIAKSANNEFVDAILTNTKNKIGLVGYDYVAKDINFHKLSSDSTSLKNKINSWAASGGTCICCGINKATQNIAFALTGELNVLDQSGNGNHGNLYGFPRYISGIKKSALEFSGDSYIKIPNSNSVNIAGSGLTIAFWVNPVDDNAYDSVILGKPWTAGVMADPYYQYGVELDRNGDDNFDFIFTDTTATLRTISTAQKASYGAWQHIAFTYDGANIKAYYNGVLSDSVSATQNIQARATDLIIGADAELRQTFVGKLDELRIYSRALTLAEIQGIYTTSALCSNNIAEAGERCDGTSCTNNRLTAYYTFDNSIESRQCDNSCSGVEACDNPAICGDGRVKAGEECDDGNTLNDDGCSNTCKLEQRERVMLVMTDGLANAKCQEQSTNDEKQDAIQSACNAHNNYGITVHAVSFGSDADQSVMQGIANCGGGTFYDSSDISKLEEIYKQVAQDLVSSEFVNTFEMGLKVILISDTGSETIEISNPPIQPYEKKLYTLTTTLIDINRIEIYPFIVKNGREIIGSMLDAWNV